MSTFNIVNGSKRTRVKNAVAAGTSNQAATTIDMQGFESVVFEVCFGTLTAGQVTSLKCGGGAASNGSDATDLKGTAVGPLADGDSNKMLVLEVVRPAGYRYLTLTILRGTQNAVIDSAVATQYHSRKTPETDDATTVSATKTVVSPIAGTP